MQKTQYMLFSLVLFFFLLKTTHIHFLQSAANYFADNVCWLNYLCTSMSIKQNTVHAFSSTKKYLHKIVLVLCTCQWTL